MQDLVGIVRREEEILSAFDKIQELKKCAARVGVTGNREYNTGWHTALDLDNLLTISEIIGRAALQRRKVAERTSVTTSPKRMKSGHSVTSESEKPDGCVLVEEIPVKEMPSELRQVIEENK